MKIRSIAAALAGISLVACATGPAGSTSLDAAPSSVFDIVPDMLQASYQNYLSVGQTPKSKFQFTNSSSFDGQLFASLAKNSKDENGVLNDVLVEFPEGTEDFPDRNYKWLSVVALKHGPEAIRKCDTFQDDGLEGLGTFLLVLNRFIKPGLQIKEVSPYKAIIEYNSGEERITGIRYYDANTSAADKTASYGAGQCDVIALQDIMNAENVFE